jgi:hypothetical protein
MADAERRISQIRLGTTTATTAATYNGHFFVADDSLLTDVGFISTTAIAAASTSLISQVWTAISPAAVATTLVTLNNPTPLGVTAAGAALTVTSRYVIISLGTTTNAEWNTLAGTSTIGFKTYKAGDTFLAAVTGTGTGDGTVAPLTLPVANDTFGWAGYLLPLSHPLSVTGKATVAGTTSVANVAINVNLESRYYATDVANPTAVAYGALPANAPYGGNVLSTVKPEFAAMGFGYANRDGIRIPAGYTLRCAFSVTAAAPTYLDVSAHFGSRPGRD